MVFVAPVSQTVAGYVHNGVRSKRPRKDPDQAHSAYVSVADGLDDLCNQWPGGVSRERPLWIPVGGRDRRNGVLERTREAAGHQLEQLGQAKAGRGSHRNDGVKGAARHSGLKVSDQRLQVNVFATE